ncbi:MAG TPA: 1-deoxy-D-xylulose-5-phosphate reductoisomerase [Candidatus Eisenbacteria bacterium]|jgi:1-deoxy-D-xylulose-5-phosphate reductoisomerase
MKPKRLMLLGATGSIGARALEVADRHPGRIQVVALAARRSAQALARLARRLRPEALALEQPDDVARARAELTDAAPGARLHLGEGAAARLVVDVDCDVVLNGIVGAAGLGASLAALEQGRRLALANKETLVVGGPLVRAALAHGGELVPVDSEHSAALQCLGGRPANEVVRLILTASGGALRDHPDWRRATPAEVLAHPVWDMGPRITVDSALLFNKGLEMIEAEALFHLGWGQLEAVLHREARVHALVEFRDGALVAQAAAADMRLPIQLAITWPERWEGPGARLPALPLAGLEFEPIPPGRHPGYDLALAAGRTGGTAPCVLNAADEVAVDAFLGGQVALVQVPEIVGRVLDSHRVEAVESLAQLAHWDAWARETARHQAVRA